MAEPMKLEPTEIPADEPEWTPEWFLEGVAAGKNTDPIQESRRKVEELLKRMVS